jgi:hypothetical protein
MGMDRGSHIQRASITSRRVTQGERASERGGMGITTEKGAGGILCGLSFRFPLMISSRDGLRCLCDGAVRYLRVYVSVSGCLPPFA